MTDLAERTAPAPPPPLPPVERPQVDQAWSLRRSLAVLAVVATMIAAARTVATAASTVSERRSDQACADRARPTRGSGATAGGGAVRSARSVIDQAHRR